MEIQERENIICQSQRFELNEMKYIWKTDSCHDNYVESSFDKLCKLSWNFANKKGVLNYHVENIETKVLEGDYRLIAQLNPFREAMKRTPVFVMSLKQEFDTSKFNFSLIKNEEILFEMVHQGKKSNGTCNIEDDHEEEILSATVVVNTAPITTTHSLIVPSRMSFKSQLIDYEGLLFGVTAILVSNTPALKVGFNSLGAMASVNHYHLHIYYLPYPIYVETAECIRLAGPLFTFKNHYAPGFVFQLEDKNVENLVRNVEKLTNFLIEKELCHNIMITRGVKTDNEGKDTDASSSVIYNSVRVCVWIRKPSYGIKKIKGFAVALCELAGHLPVYDEETYNSITEEIVTKDMREACHEIYTQHLPEITALFS